MKVAIYSRGKRLAIREQPSAEAPIIGTMGSGCAAHVEDAAPGWLELTMGGYIREDLVTVGSLVDTTTHAIKDSRAVHRSRRRNSSRKRLRKRPNPSLPKSSPRRTTTPA